jgi:hypothetical protein
MSNSNNIKSSNNSYNSYNSNDSYSLYWYKLLLFICLIIYI